MPATESPAPSTPAAPVPVEGPLLARLTAGFYGFWTLLPNSNSWMVGWPWVAIWQGAVGLPVVWLLWQGWYQPPGRLGLGRGWTSWLGAAIALVLLSALTATFPHAARWQGFPVLGTLAAGVALHSWLRTPDTPPQPRQRWLRLAEFQGALAIALIVISLGLWLTQTYWPERQHLAALATQGIERSFGFNLLDVRNWYPLGHQNYVAGYLVLNLPLLAGLAGSARGPWRGAWIAGTVLGLLDLYTTGSRAGTLGLLGAALTAVLLLAASRPWSWSRWLLGGLGIVVSALGFLWLNPRLWRSLQALLGGNFSGGELAYRWITTVTGWRMGLAQPWTGLGPGSTPFAYQRYRPLWAGREAELIYQLHNTPIQIWAELGLGGLLLLGGFGILVIKLAGDWLGTLRNRGRTDAATPTPKLVQPPPLLVGSLLAGLAGYGLVSLTDYQLDNVAISGSLVIFIALLVQISAEAPKDTHPIPASVPARPSQREASDPSTPSSVDESAPAQSAELAHEAAPKTPPRWRRRLVLAGMGLSLAGILWLMPVHRAWSLASDGFVALADGNVNRFSDRLRRAHALVPQAPYYPYQLGWNLGELSRQGERDPAEVDRLQADAIAWFDTANAILPDWEFGHSNVAWLRRDREPAAALQNFTTALTLVPAKEGIALGLAVQLLQLQQRDLAIRFLALEAIRHPAVLTSGLWQQPGFAAIATAVQAQVLDQWSTWLEQPDLDPPLADHLHRVRGSLHWWRGDWAAAQADWQTIQYNPGLALVALAESGTVSPDQLSPGNPVALTLQAWLDPTQRPSHLTQAWAAAPVASSSFAEALIPPPVLETFLTGMDNADGFLDWLQTQVPNLPERNTRLGFGVLIRQIDGPPPVDYGVQVKNLAMTTLLQELLPSPTFLPALDEALLPLQAEAIAALQALHLSP
jgi:uncharacterized protein involved in response to NO